MTESIPIRNGAIPISSRKMVRFTPNVPVEIALQCADGVRVEGRYGDRVKYTLTDDRTMYVDPFVAERIKELDIQPGELFLVCKRQARKAIARPSIGWSSGSARPKLNSNGIFVHRLTELRAPETKPHRRPVRSRRHVT